MARWERGEPTRSGISLLAVVKGYEEQGSVTSRPSKVFQSPVLRVTATLLLVICVFHVGMSHRGAQRKENAAPRVLVLPDGKALPKPVTSMNTCPADMPLIQEGGPVLEDVKLKELQNALKNSTWIAPLGRRTGRLGTKGVKVTFNTVGVETLYGIANLTELASFFNAERLPVANAWVMTLVAVEGCPGFHAEQGIWAIHRDELSSSKEIPFEENDRIIKIFPHTVTVFAVDAPGDVLGGATWLWNSNSTAVPAGVAPSAIVPPKTNAKFTFRGDAFHGYTGQNSSRPAAVISMLLEQYKIPTGLYSQTQEFKVERFRTEYRAKRPDKRVYHPMTEEQQAAAAAVRRRTNAA